MLERREFLSEVARIAKLSEQESDTPWMDAIEELTLRHGLDVKMVGEWIGRKQEIRQNLKEEATRMRIRTVRDDPVADTAHDIA